jgi:hypothetical protein
MLIKNKTFLILTPDAVHGQITFPVLAASADGKARLVVG